ncbi:LutB/LldF family L-lactate oxidation iron-sulfur protein [Raineyella sp. W15-4]|uniref:LutB/LldF family L-lactate oxidation iron-sulfur protein n=1 Tax=Raineyella sp. W15-4 TaxID=3081651 RepID=UPI003989CD0A
MTATQQPPRDKDGRLTPAPPDWTTRPAPPFPEAAIKGLENQVQRANLRHATGTIRAKRVRVVAEVDNWQDLRSAGEAIKNRTLRHLDQHLETLEASLTRAGATVHWARDAADANKLIVDLVKATGEREVTKVKSMVTQEIGMNEALEEAGIAAWETDLAELIVQLGHDFPSHILVPAIHRNRGEIREIFREEMGVYGTPAPEGLSEQPAELAGAARTHLRNKFLRTRVAISGANFAIAETGTLVVVESEGNGRMNLTLPETLISVVGIEKVLPTVADLEVFLRLLPRSSTGERMNPYTSMWSGPTEGDGPQDVHVILLDNGRTNALADPKGREALRCIRCSACLNICPVYERVGGHAYGSVYPGPIGAILNPQLRGVDNPIDKSLPFASSLCGACTEVCPVKIPIADLLVHERHRVVEEKKRHQLNQVEPTLMKAASWVMADHRHLEAAGRASSLAGRLLPIRTIGPLPGPLSRWTQNRDVPMVPAQTFRQWWQENRGSKENRDERA